MSSDADEDLPYGQVEPASRRKGPPPALGLLRPLSDLYGALAGLKNIAYDRGWTKGKRLRWPVISVGNLSVGGAGKTPVVIRLAELLAERGVQVSVLSRGYGRDSQAIEVVDVRGSADRFGDEPLMIARRLIAGGQGIAPSIVVGAERYAAGLVAESLPVQLVEANPPEAISPEPLSREAGAVGSEWQSSTRLSAHILDDGFQHRRLARELDVVVVHRSDFDERLLPVGRLREGLGSLRRASVVVLREEDAALEAALRRLGVSAPVWFVRRSVYVPDAPVCVVAFCGIARPEEFFDSVRQTVKRVAAERAFQDHHRYSAEDVDGLRRVAVEHHASSFVTTEKDAVRLSPELLERLSGGSPGLPLVVAELRVTFLDEELVVKDLMKVVGA
ncbi:MAG TPA: tetraacyldisaccharide 4'-kinase [Acidisarcina sp.]